MNECKGEKRERNKTLLIVEGNHEKNKLFWALFKSFPEMNIQIENVWIYGTNIYQLYRDITTEYGTSWAEDGTDVDLPFVISKKQNMSTLRYKNDFTNILLVFDYERHDTYFSESKILDMQKSFSDITDMGQLYINYPMVESYLHLNNLHDMDYLDRKVSVTLRPGTKYKSLVSKESGIEQIFTFPRRLCDLLKEKYGVIDEAVCNQCCENILSGTNDEDLGNILRDNLTNILQEDVIQKLILQLSCWISNLECFQKNESYWKYLRQVFVDIIYQNIWKANYIQNNVKAVESGKYRECYGKLDLLKILDIQNDYSEDDVTGFIWVLNTCIFIVAEYNFALVEK